MTIIIGILPPDLDLEAQDLKTVVIYFSSYLQRIFLIIQMKLQLCFFQNNSLLSRKNNVLHKMQVMLVREVAGHCQCVQPIPAGVSEQQQHCH